MKMLEQIRSRTVLMALKSYHQQIKTVRVAEDVGSGEREE
jgi:hypothetical protein